MTKLSDQASDAGMSILSIYDDVALFSLKKEEISKGDYYFEVYMYVKKKVFCIFSYILPLDIKIKEILVHSAIM